MADASAEGLAELLITAEQPIDPSGVDALGELLRADPPLLLWTVCAAGQADGPVPRSVADCARWLAEHAFEVLFWPQSKRSRPKFPDADLCASMAAMAVIRGEVAARLAEDEKDGDAEQAALMALLRDATSWLEAVGKPAAKNGSPLPPWLVDALGNDDDAVLTTADRIARSVVETEGQPPSDLIPESIDFDPLACWQRANECRRRWSAPGGRLAALLPSVTAKFKRLGNLEDEFRTTVEAEKLEAMAEFAAGAGHEINNPLTVIAGRAQLFLREETDPQRRRDLALMNAQAMRVYEMIADMRLFARPPEPEPETVDAVALVDALIEELAPQYAAQSIEISRPGDDEPIRLEVDPTQLTVALRAMCQNSVEAIGRDGHIEIGIVGEPSQVRISVRDDGPGITAEERRHLFDPYYSARQAGRGLGLGLSKCWRIVVTNHGGQIDVESQPGQGSTFVIALPRKGK